MSTIMNTIDGETKSAPSKVLGVGIIGCGLIGQKRAGALGSGGRFIACADINIGRAEQLANRFSGTAYPVGVI